MKNIFSRMLTVLLICCLVLTGCGGGGGGGGASSGNSSYSGVGSGSYAPGSTHNPAVNPHRTVEIPDKAVDLSDDSIYFVIIDGVKYSLFDRTTQDFLDAGYTLSEYDDPNREIEPDGKSGKEPGSNISWTTEIYKRSYSSDNAYFKLRSYNHTNKALPMKDCAVYEIIFEYDQYAKDDETALSALIYTVCNLAPGCTEEDVINVFGDNYDKFMYDFGELIYNERSLSRTWEFYRDEPSDPIRRIKINTNFGYYTP